MAPLDSSVVDETPKHLCLLSFPFSHFLLAAKACSFIRTKHNSSNGGHFSSVTPLHVFFGFSLSLSLSFSPFLFVSPPFYCCSFFFFFL